ncbi:putative phage tail protein [Paenibacillus radicis (ex Gao et al. 2016)]|uniref:Phage portal protein n=1 Tax=Paenibacillus radicis (ex Gao et al. 2016) TaxID=1737354 RepID=A0A917HJP0_9BACL|nr:putative phage tail protein [Paenibacillus radicis (ex Gao et al. 2016)]GGG81716.1 hypothetical protein GCM10010918_43780 [Paenibacillus radicis (ex Gao et al. 2016)]
MNDTVVSPIGKVLLNHLPQYYEDVRESRIICQTEGVELDSLESASAGVLSQRFVDSATWGLQRWEKELGIAASASQPLEQRRAVIRSRIRGAGTVRGQLIKSVAEAYYGGMVDVSVKSEQYQVIVRFVSKVGVPPNLDDLKAAIDEIIPSHLTVKYAFRYLLIKDINLLLTLNELEATPLSNFVGGSDNG